MIVIFNSIGIKLKTIPHNDEFFNHISAGELLEEHPECEREGWSFIIFPSKKVGLLSENLKKEFLTPPIQEAYEQQLDLIEICRGDFKNLTWVPITPNLNVGAIKKEWYLDYCRKHGHFLEDNLVISWKTQKEEEAHA